MAKRRANAHALRRNARLGARVTWCPECKRKAALGKNWGGGVRVCRYCGYRADDSPKMRRMRLAQFDQWEKEQASGRDAAVEDE